MGYKIETNLVALHSSSAQLLQVLHIPHCWLR